MLVIAPRQKTKYVYIFDFFNMKLYCVFSLESPRGGDSNEYIQYTIFNVKGKSALIITNLQLLNSFQGSQRRVRNIRSKRAISVRATDVLQNIRMQGYRKLFKRNAHNHARS